MKNILLPTDFSENSWNAIKYAIRFFETSTCHFHLLHVDRLSYMVTGDIPYTATENVIEEVYTKPAKVRLRKILKQISKTFPEHKNHKFHTHTDYNFFIESIKNFVDDKDIDCIVMGTKGASGLSQYLIGTNTNDVIKKIKCTLLAVPENADFKKISEIALPTDFLSGNDPEILEFIAKILKRYKASLRIVHVNKKKAELNKEQQINKNILEAYFAKYEHSFHFLTNNKIEEGIQCFIDSRDINMIFMVAKNLNYFQQILFHSNVEDLSYHLEIPFFVLHEKNK